MNTALALVEASPVVASLREVNALEELITGNDSDADRWLWQQAERVVELLATGMSQAALAKLWIDVRKGKPYSQMHVSFTARVFQKFTFEPRPLFREAYNAIANRSGFCFGNGDEDWYTREDIIEAARTVLGRIDLDPASCSAANAVVKATRFFTIEDDGLSQPWSGRVWLNPPYSRGKISLFVDKIVTHVTDGSVTAAIIITNSTTGTRWFATLYRHADSVCFPTGRLNFWKPDRAVRGSAAYPSVIFYFGPDSRKFDDVFAQFVWRGEEDR